ncbi:CocE/NonD family hydrolase [Phytoactinopolyspora halotolerans]|uniref:X-prolyl-dipeptidyl aminopeptidase n=1 Tax=Phytoactinopolyspora halotolerans TaxID=1981512 RepID=A0A6L9S8A9_9ACTN|nr:CocE/NonD family hydrolase [Phytoactinopolyspora halotolerans]NEE00220.1 X-prolyl-dipeptidyl aminopeptidase [Phytoactinopolyspora halotolerans]
MRGLRGVRRRAAVVIAAGLLAASAIPAMGQPQPDHGTVDDGAAEWPATDVFGESSALDPDAAWQERQRLDRAGPAATSAVAEPDEIAVAGGVTQPAFDYAGAVREAVVIPGAVSSQDGGELDEIYVDIIRPAASDGELRVPTIIIPSPYYHANGRGRLGETKPVPGEPIDAFPLYYDNYFVPRGYAVAYLDLAGTRGSSGCLDIGGPAEIDNTVKLVEWLNGSGTAYDLDGREVAADWSNGLSAMVGKSWDGTVANGVAATGVDGLATIVPIAAISSWHQWYWHNGVHFQGHTALSLATSIQNGNQLPPFSECGGVRDELALGEVTADPEHEFWTERDFIRDAENVKASVFIVHGTNDYNVKPVNYGAWWDALAAHDVPRKIWLSPVAHEKAFDFRRDEWLDTIHRWFDHWLHGIDNGIMDEPVADVEHGLGQWDTYQTWPGGTTTLLRLGRPEGPDDPRPGVLGLSRANVVPRTQSFVETRRPVNSVVQDGFAADERRLVFMTDELTEPVRISGSTSVSLRVTVDGADAGLSAYIVDYGTAERTDWSSGGGIRNLSTISCFGQGTATDTGCYPDVERATRTLPHEVVARGWARASFVAGEDSLVPGSSYRMQWDIMTDDYVFEPGHRIGIVIAGVDTNIQSRFNFGNTVEVNLSGSHVRLPVVGGARALRLAGSG